MEKDLCKFIDNIEIINKDFSKYEDEEGNLFIFNTINSLLRVNYLELKTEQLNKDIKSEYELMVIQNKIEDLEYKTKKVTKKVPKSDITGKKEDYLTLVDKEVEVKQIWNVSNSYEASKCFIDKEEAIKFAKDFNKTILEYYK